MEGYGQTERQRITGLLQGRMLTAREISKAAGIREKDVLEHLEHVMKSAGKAFRTEPSRCLDCGFVFRKRGRLRTPGKCPVCRSEAITETRFGIAG